MNTPFLPQNNNPLFTPFKKNNFYMTSSNNYQNLSNSSEIFLGSMKDFSNNNKNNIPLLNNFQFNISHPKGRKLLEDFNKYTLNKNVENQENNINNNHINNNNINSSKYNISNNNFSFLIPININEKKYDNKKESEIKTEIIKTNKIIISDNNASINHNMFFTDYGLGYKCNCQKTQCNKFYCQCYREKRYCFNCNCVGCNNQKPDYLSTNKQQCNENNKEKKTITVSCTCTKSGCNKNYCECYKSKVKCNSLCRCRNCENCKEGNIEKYDNNNGFKNYECCLANSVFIVKNEITVEDINKNQNQKKKKSPIKREIKILINENLLSSFSSEENGNVGYKRKRKKGDKDINIDKFTPNKKPKLSDENTDDATKNKKKYIEGDLFDKDGKLILTNFKFD